MSETNPHRSGAPDLDARIEAIECKLMHAEDQIESLNLSLYRQQQAIEKMQAQIKDLKALAAASAPEARRPEDEIPPHY